MLGDIRHRAARICRYGNGVGIARVQGDLIDVRGAEGVAESRGIRTAFTVFPCRGIQKKNPARIGGAACGAECSHQCAVHRTGISAAGIGRQATILCFVSRDGRCDLNRLVFGRGLFGRIQGVADCRKSKPCKDCDDGDHDEQLDQGESPEACDSCVGGIVHAQSVVGENEGTSIFLFAST